MVGPASTSASLREYLRRYESNNRDEKKKKKKKKAKTDATGLLVVDEDPIWQQPVKIEEEEDEDSPDEEKPQVDEDIEVKRMKRLEMLKSLRPFGAISEDGSGWVSVSDTSKSLQFKDQSSDISPPRKQRARNDTPSPEPELNPPWKQRSRIDTPSPEPDSNPSTIDADLSPLRTQTLKGARYDTPSPERRHSDSGREVMDLSPHRRRQRLHQTPSPEPATKSVLPSDRRLDLSPPRRSHPQKSSQYERANSEIRSEDDLSPPRKRRNDRPRSDAFLSQQSSRCLARDSSSHLSSASDLSPPSKVRKESPLKQLPKTGLISGQDIKEEIANKQKEDWSRFNNMDPSISGRGAEPVYRDKITGERISKDQVLKSQKKEEKPKEIKLEWGKGLAQKRETEARLQELELEKDKPFARMRDDPDLDRAMKERVRWGDPMAHLVKKKHTEPILPDFGESESMRESGFIIPQEIPGHSWIRRGLDAAPNRYGIKPGRHWDGVDRSNGYEKELFKRMNEKQATQREAYLWSVSDM